MENPTPLWPALVASAGVMFFVFCLSFIGITIMTIWVYHVVKWLNWMYRPKPPIQKQEIAPPDYEAEAAEAQRKLAMPVTETPPAPLAPPAPPAVTDDPESKYGPKEHRP